ncbi:MAG: polysaccharide deacetylase family protein [Aggregatilineales bacterium]
MLLRRFMLLFVFVMCCVLGIIPISATSDGWILYGNEPQFANNIILTIDDASIESNVRIMFEYLRDRGMTATFFPNTHYINHQDSQLWRDIVSAGFEIGYHTRNHNSYLTPEQLSADFTLFQEEIRTTLQNPSYTIRYVRPPNGVWNADWLTWASDNHLMTVRWNITSETEDIGYMNGVLHNRTQGGSILLLHTGSNDVQWLQTNLPYLVEMRDDQQNPYHITSITRAFND